MEKIKYNNMYCIYHSADLDGRMSRAICQRFAIKNGITFIPIGWTHGDPIPEILSKQFPGGSLIVIADVCMPSDVMLQLLKQNHAGIQFNGVNMPVTTVWIDHHKSSIEDSEEKGYDLLDGIREIGKGACELTHLFLFPNKAVPLSIQYLSAWDVFDKSRFDWDSVRCYNYAMRGRDDENSLYKLVEAGESIGGNVTQLKSMSEDIFTGAYILDYENERLRKVAEGAFHAQILLKDQQLSACVINTTDFSTETFKAVWDSTYDVMLAFSFNGLKWRCSLYSDKIGIDCAEIAREFGGGGHLGAAGFMLESENIMNLFSCQVLASPKFNYLP